MLENRWAVQPMEGWDANPAGLPSEDTLRRWRRFGSSGAQLIWGGEAVAVCASGRANPNQLFLDREGENAAGLERLRFALHEGHREQGLDPDRMCLGLQLTHSGRYARPEGRPRPQCAHHHPVLDARLEDAGAKLKLLSDGELEGIAERFVKAAVIAQRVGFDFVDIKVCHGYLLHELLSAHTRTGRYGGAFENRVSLFRAILEAVARDAPGLGLGVRVSLIDAPPFEPGQDGEGQKAPWPTSTEHASLGPRSFGFGTLSAGDPAELSAVLDDQLWQEPEAFLRLLPSLGVSLVNVTLSSPYWCPHWQRPAAYPPSDGYLPPEDPLAGVLRHLRVARRAKQVVPQMVVVGSGYSYLQEWLPHVAEHEVARGHVDFVGLGRSMLSYPDLPLDHLNGVGLKRKQICRTFSDCTTAPRNGLPSGCWPLDTHYKSRGDAAELKRIKAAKRALQE